MKIGILFRGPVRPSFDEAKACIDRLKDQLKDHELYTFAITWKNMNLDNTPNSDVFKVLNEVNDVLIVDEPKIEFCHSLVNPNSLRSYHANCYKVFWQSKVGLDYIKNTNYKFDFIIVTRFDSEIKFGNFSNWFDPNFYTMPNQFSYDGGNDQFGVGTLDMCLKAWDYKDVKSLDRLYTTSNTVEHCLINIGLSNGANMRLKDAEFYQLSQTRYNNKIHVPH